MSSRRVFVAAVFSCLVAWAHASSPGAPFGDLPTVKELVQNSGVIGEFTVDSKSAAMSELPMAQYVYRGFVTTVTFRVNELIKGTLRGGDTLTLNFPGGEAPDGGVGIVPGTPFFDVAERVILFVDADTQQPPLFHGEFGKFSIERDPETGKEIVCNAWGAKITGYDAVTGDFTVARGVTKKATHHIGPAAARIYGPSDSSPVPAPSVSGNPTPEGVSPDAFKTILRRFMAQPR